jgi:hypothetical protein
MDVIVTVAWDAVVGDEGGDEGPVGELPPQAAVTARRMMRLAAFAKDFFKISVEVSRNECRFPGATSPQLFPVQGRCR